MVLATWTDTQILNQLDSGLKWSNPVITYSFATSTAGIYTGGGEGAGFSALDPTAQDRATLALSLWDDLIAPDMLKSTSGTSYSSTNIEFGMTNTGISYAHGYYYYPSAGSVWFSSAYASGGNNLVTPEIGRHGFMTYIHEIGHAMGLEHMGDYNGSTNSGPSCYQDSTVYSIMSYYGPNWGNTTSAGYGQVAWADWVAGNGVLYSPQTPMLNDVMAIQSMYGAETTTRTDDTVYGFNSNITGGAKAIFDFTVNLHPILCIYDSAGVDTLDLSGFSTACTIDLAPGSFSHCDNMTYNISIAYSCSIENAVGGAGADTIAGNALANLLTGNGGSDTLFGRGGDDRFWLGSGNDRVDGGAGSDTLYFGVAWSTLSYVYDVGSAALSFTSVDGAETVSNVEYFVDSLGVQRSFSELSGVAVQPFVSINTAAQPSAEGNAGVTSYSFTVSLSAIASAEQSVQWSVVLPGGADQADASDFASALSGTAVIAAGSSSSSITISVIGDTLVESDEGFSVALTSVTGGATIAGGTSSALIINDDLSPTTAGPLSLTGSSGNDSLIGGAYNDTLDGLSGNDTLLGLDGNDNLIGGAGSDVLTGGAGADIFDFNAAGEASQIAKNTIKSSDVIADFQTGCDEIDLSTIDASTKLSGNNGFTWLGTAAISTSSAGELRFQQYDNIGSDNDYTMIYGDTNSDTKFEFAIKVLGLINLSDTEVVL